MNTATSASLFALVCAPALAQPVWTYEARSVGGNVYAPSGTNGDSASSMSNMLRFQASISPTISGECSPDGMEIGSAFATASADQDSYFSELGAFAKGSATALVGEISSVVTCGSSCDATSGGVAEFTLSSATAFTLRFDLFSRRGSASINLYHRTSDTYPIQVLAQTEGPVAGHLSGVLAPGRYLLDWGSSTQAATPDTLPVTVSYDFELLIGAETPCFADFNRDGGVDGADVEAFFVAWATGEAGADVNADGGVDGADVESFFIAWEAGGCG